MNPHGDHVHVFLLLAVFTCDFYHLAVTMQRIALLFNSASVNSTHHEVIKGCEFAVNFNASDGIGDDDDEEEKFEGAA